jgi:hypothetical protein
MPWCTDCDRFYNPNSLNEDGTCPSGHLVADPEETPDDGAKPQKLRKFNDEPAPWHFKVLVGGVSVYLAYRLVQGIGWVAHHV